MDPYRKLFLDFHNGARLRVAKGIEPKNGGYLNPAKNIYYSSNGFSNPTTTINSALNNWWNGKNGVNDPQNKYNNGQLYAFSNMIFSETTKIGCAYQVCGTYMTVTCLYNGLGYFTDKSMWETGSACRTGSECTTYKNSRCESGLCIKGPDVPETNKKCPKNHGMTDSVRETFLTMHNKLRSSLALGREPDALGGNAPWAARMPRMVYDCKVEASALRNALRCVYGHSNDRNGLGENIYRTTALNFDKNKAAKEASQLWWDELKKFGVGKSTNLTEEMWYLKGGKIGHYTQVK
ncbi:SCP-like protein [Necator americanus]|uniref:SCP-like protein n=1 Tax=Necator americanus TaxID=51031 RepID=W2TGX8_NECAM|nr:SCP-like protein [Necator americanus]ETN80839.1 SCP-like protein [Necator americanus]